MDPVEEMFKDLDRLDHFYNKNYINLSEYFEIKHKIIEKYRPNTEQKEKEPNNANAQGTV